MAAPLTWQPDCTTPKVLLTLYGSMNSGTYRVVMPPMWRIRVANYTMVISNNGKPVFGSGCFNPVTLKVISIACPKGTPSCSPPGGCDHHRLMRLTSPHRHPHRARQSRPDLCLQAPLRPRRRQELRTVWPGPGVGSRQDLPELSPREVFSGGRSAVHMC